MPLPKIGRDILPANWNMSVGFRGTPQELAMSGGIQYDPTFNDGMMYGGYSGVGYPGAGFASRGRRGSHFRPGFAGRYGGEFGGGFGGPFGGNGYGGGYGAGHGYRPRHGMRHSVSRPWGPHRVIIPRMSNMGMHSNRLGFGGMRGHYLPPYARRRHRQPPLHVAPRRMMGNYGGFDHRMGFDPRMGDPRMGHQFIGRRGGGIGMSMDPFYDDMDEEEDDLFDWEDRFDDDDFSDDGYMSDEDLDSRFGGGRYMRFGGGRF